MLADEEYCNILFNVGDLKPKKILCLSVWISACGVANMQPLSFCLFV